MEGSAPVVAASETGDSPVRHALRRLSVYLKRNAVFYTIWVRFLFDTVLVCIINVSVCASVLIPYQPTHQVVSCAYYDCAAEERPAHADAYVSAVYYQRISRCISVSDFDSP